MQDGDGSGQQSTTVEPAGNPNQGGSSGGQDSGNSGGRDTGRQSTVVEPTETRTINPNINIRTKDE